MRIASPMVGLGWACWLATLTGCIGNLEPFPAGSNDPAGTQIAADIQTTDTVAQSATVAIEPAGKNLPLCVAAGGPATPTHVALLAALNEYRQENGLPALIYSKTLEAAANADVADLWERSFFAHINPDGLDPGQRAVAAGFCHQYVGENIAAGQTTVDNVMRAWKNSPGHNENMLEPLYVYVGVGHSVDSNGRHYWAQEFAYELP